MSQMSSASGVPQWDLADRLVKARKVRGVKQAEMAEHLGLSRAAISAFENGDVAPRLAYLRLWSIRCGVPLEWLQDGTDPTQGGDGPGLTQSSWSPPTVAQLALYEPAATAA